MKMEKMLALLLALAMAAALVACGGSSAQPAATKAPAEVTPESAPVEKTEIIVFAAASMTETLTQLGEQYMAEHPEVSIVFNFDSSGTLKTQIQEGADCDIFISAGQKQMNQLDIAAKPESNPDGLDFVKEGTRFNILENKVALAVPEGNPAGIESYDDLAAKLTVVDTATAEMCGQVIYPAAILKNSQNADAARAFLDYLVSDAGDAVFEAVGFTPVA